MWYHMVPLGGNGLNTPIYIYRIDLNEFISIPVTSDVNVQTVSSSRKIGNNGSDPTPGPSG